jgi:hypothetical protein
MAGDPHAPILAAHVTKEMVLMVKVSIGENEGERGGDAMR